MSDKADTKNTDHINVKKIRINIKIVKNWVNKQKSKGIKDSQKLEYSVFDNLHDIYVSFPSIVKMICKDQDMKEVDKMLNELEKVEEGEASLKEVEKTLGDEYANKFLYPKVKDVKDVKDVKEVNNK